MRRAALLGVGAAVAIAAGGIAVAGSALATSSTHTLHLSTTRLQFVNTSHTTFVETDVAERAGKEGRLRDDQL
jgi:hypothetical protein